MAILHVSLLVAVTQLMPGGGVTTALPIVQAMPLISVASWYEQGVKTASGAKFDPNGYTAAHRTLEFGTPVLVINPVTWWDPFTWCVVWINDRGPHKKGRQIDLARAPAAKVGLKEMGVAKLITIVLPMPPAQRAQTAKAKLPRSASRNS
jgi:rare lipoprotein A